jgi:molybdenum cofactor cytidylyltransferase
MIFAVVPAAGKSVRMGQPKLTLLLGGRSVLERVIHALRSGGVEDVLVVVGPDGAELAAIAELAGAYVLRMKHETPDMRATVEQGLAWLEQRFHPRDEDSWLLVPADHPTLDASAIEQLLLARSSHPQASIVIPFHAGQRGHPALIAWRHVGGIRALMPGQGLNAYLRSHAGQTFELSVVSPSVLCDLDTPDDYERLQREFPDLAG